MPNQLSYAIGSEVQVHDRICVITALTDIDQVLIRYKDDGATEAVNLVNLKCLDDAPKDQSRALDAIHDQDLDEAQKRFAAIEPLLSISEKRGTAVQQRAKELGLHSSTLYRWLRAFGSVERKSILAPRRRGKRKKRLNKKKEAIIRNVLETFCLCKQKYSQKRVIEEVTRRCRTARLKPPHSHTVRSRIKELDAKEKMKRRHGAKAARDKYGAVTGSFPNADYPLSYWQIDHTKLDIILVDDEHREPIGRPWLTLAIDVHSRMIAGIYLSLEAPSAFSVGMCLTHGMLQKDAYLEKVGVEGTWPVWGIPNTLHADNGKDFRSKSIQKSLDEYNISLEWRPVKRPEYGGHVERVFGTLSKRIHGLPGTTFSNIKDKGEYKSEKVSALSFDEFEQWLVNIIVNNYHQNFHRGINMPPFNKWREGILGNGKVKGTGHPPLIADPDRLRLDFLPYEERTVQRDGIVWDNVHYFSDVLRPLIKAEKGGKIVKFIVRRDPRDISTLYFLDPELEEYFHIPYRDLGKPSVTLWEFRAAYRELKRQGMAAVNEDNIFKFLDISQEIEERAQTKTKKVRRNKQRRKNLEQPNYANQPSGIRVIVNNSETDDDDGEFNINIDDIEDNWEDWS